MSLDKKFYKNYLFDNNIVQTSNKLRHANFYLNNFYSYLIDSTATTNSLTLNPDWFKNFAEQLLK